MKLETKKKYDDVINAALDNGSRVYGTSSDKDIYDDLGIGNWTNIIQQQTESKTLIVAGAENVYPEYLKYLDFLVKKCLKEVWNLLQSIRVRKITLRKMVVYNLRRLCQDKLHLNSKLKQIAGTIITLND